MSLARRKPFNSNPPTLYHMTAEQRGCLTAMTKAWQLVERARYDVRKGVADVDSLATSIDRAIEALNAAKGYCK